MRDWITRRKFLDTVLGVGAAGTTFVVAYPLLRFVNPPKRSSEGSEWVDAGPLAEIPEGGFKVIMSNTGVPLLLVNRGSEDIVALEKKCPHLGCMVELGQGEVICPCHGAKFTYEGVRIAGPAPRDLKRYAVEKRPDGRVYVGKEVG